MNFIIIPIIIFIAVIFLYMFNVVLVLYVAASTDYKNMIVIDRSRMGKNEVTLQIKSRFFPQLIEWISIENGRNQSSNLIIPEGFIVSKGELLSEQAFEPDLSVLLDEFSEDKITEEIVQKEQESQYEEYLRMEHDCELNLLLTGKIWVFPLLSKTVSLGNVPVEVNYITIGTNVMFGFISSSEAYSYQRVHANI